MRVRGHSRSLKLVPFESLGTASYSPSTVTILYHFIDKHDNGRKSRLFHTSLAFDADIRRSSSEYCHTVLCGITRMVWLLDCEKKFEDLFGRFDRIPACDGQTDGRPDGQTYILRRHSPRSNNSTATDHIIQQ